MSLLLFIIAVLSHAQDRKVVLTGNVYDHDGKSVENGTVFLLRQGDSSIVKTALMVDGVFKLDAVEKGKYVVKLSCLGFHDWKGDVVLENDTTIRIGVVVFATELKDVSVISNKPMFSSKDGNLKLEVENSIFESIPSVADLLGKLPGILVTQDKTQIASIDARGAPLLYLDNQKVTLNDLSSLDVKDIKDIEILYNPSSKYDANGRVVILITRKKSRSQGYKVSVTQTSSVKRNYNNYDGINLSLKKNTLEFRGDFQYNWLQPWESYLGDFSILNTPLQSKYTVTAVTNGHQIVYGGGIYDQINKGDYFSLNANGNLRNVPYKITTNTAVTGNVDDSVINTFTQNQKRQDFFNAMGNYNKSFSRINGSLFIGAQYSDFQDRLASVIDNSIDGSGLDSTESRLQTTHVQVVTARADFQKNFTGGMLWESGVSLSHGWSVFNLQIDSMGNDTASEYLYSESTYGAYSQISGRGHKWVYSAGLRVQYMPVQGRFSDSSAFLVKRNPTYLFPKISITRTLDSTKSITLGYNRSINLPNFSDLSQTTVYINPYVVYSHNVNLIEALTDEVSAKFQWKDYSLRVVAYTQRNPIYLGASWDPGNQLLTTINRNYYKEQGGNIFLTIPFHYKGWRSTNTLISYFTKVEDPTAILNTPKPSLYGYTVNEIDLRNGYNLLVSGWFLTKRYNGLYEKSSLSNVTLGISKTFFNKLFVSVAVNDIFRGLNSDLKFINSNVTFDQLFYEDSKELLISAKYSFGKIKSSSYKTRAVDENMYRIR